LDLEDGLVPLKCQLALKGLHSVIFQKWELLTSAAFLKVCVPVYNRDYILVLTENVYLLGNNAV
jgi:hypothetical protein